ncbi:MAG: tetratricopeptide repeat protein [Bacteroidota bacterium]|nr:tetratricopeptide repeat protein [Bacteroidota bacterium]
MMSRSFKYFLILFATLVLPCRAQTVDDNYLKGMACLMKNKPEAAIEYFSVFISQNPNSAAGFMKRADCYYKLRNYNQAVNDYLKAEEITRGIASYSLAKTYSQTGDFAQACSCLEKHLQSKYKKSQSELKLDKAFDPLQNSKKWIELWKKDWYTSSEMAISDAVYLMKNSKYTEALDELNKAIEEKGSIGNLFACRAKVYEAMENLKNALDDYDKALSLSPGNNEYLQQRAGVLMKLNRNEEALSDLNRALALDPAQFPLYLKRADVASKLNQYDRAKEDVNFFLKYFENDSSAIYRAGMIYYNNGNYVEALGYFNKNLQNIHNNPAYFEARANTYLKSGAFNFASKDYSMALDLDPRNSDLYLCKGKALSSMQMTKDACYFWQKAVQYGNREAIELYNKNCR